MNGQLCANWLVGFVHTYVCTRIHIYVCVHIYACVYAHTYPVIDSWHNIEAACSPLASPEPSPPLKCVHWQQGVPGWWERSPRGLKHKNLSMVVLTAWLVSCSFYQNLKRVLCSSDFFAHLQAWVCPRAQASASFTYAGHSEWRSRRGSPSKLLDPSVWTLLFVYGG